MGKTVNIGKKTTDRVNTGKVAVGTSVVSLSADKSELDGGVQVTAGPANTGVVYVGTRPNLTAGTVNDTDGYPLSAGDTVFMPVSSEDKVKAIADAAAQNLFFMSY